MAAIQSGIGIAFGPRMFADSARDSVKFVKLLPAAPPLRVGYMARRGPQTEITQRFIGALRAAVADAGVAK